MEKSFNSFAQGMVMSWQAGTLQVPSLLLQHYKQLRLSEMDAMLIIHLLQFLTVEHKEFPTWEEIQERMFAPPEEVIGGLQRLLKEGMIRIDETIDAVTGVRSEKYSVMPFMNKLAELIANEQSSLMPASEHLENFPSAVSDLDVSIVKPSIFSVFEQEFARPLSPMEFETISGWLDQDQYPEELVTLALKEAVFAGKIHFKYIDRILLEWSRNRIRTVDQAKEHAQRFRGAR